MGNQASQGQANGSIQNQYSAANFAAWICPSVAITVEVFIHKNFGSRYLSINALRAIPIIVVFSLFFTGEDLVPMFWFLVTYIGMFLIKSAMSQNHTQHGKEAIHSRYTGLPYLCRWLPKWDEVKVKRLESVIVFGIGCVFHDTWHALGDYLMFASFALLSSIYLRFIRRMRTSLCAMRRSSI